MAKRSELAKGMYVRMSPQLDPDNSYWERLFAGRYFCIEDVAKEPDDSNSCGPCYGTLIFWSVNYFKPAFNGDMLLVPEEEQQRIKYVFENKHEFKDLFKVARKLERVMEKLDDCLSNYDRYMSMWDMMDDQQLAESLEASLCEAYSEEKMEEITEEAMEMWQEIIELIEELDKLEEKHIRAWVKENVA